MVRDHGVAEASPVGESSCRLVRDVGPGVAPLVCVQASPSCLAERMLVVALSS